MARKGSITVNGVSLTVNRGRRQRVLDQPHSAHASQRPP
ncbi:MAG: hypothetical protein MZV65_44145 [Chromatiales bacterium]|nr:hypothetical protein [Chromatiales bacterium]